MVRLAAAGENVLAVISVVAGGGVYLSRNHGATWTAVNTGLPYVDANTLLPVTGLAVGNTDIYAGTDSGGVWRLPLSDLAG